MRVSAVFFSISCALIATAKLADAVAGADVSVCAGAPVTVFFGSRSDRALVCEGAAKAVEFLQSHGLEASAPLRVQLRDTLPECCGAHIGFYDANSDTVELLTYAVGVIRSAGNPPFGVPMDERLYVSYAAHELAHAVADKNFKTIPASHLVHEYVAYVTQFSTMQSELRSTVLSRYDVGAYEDARAVSLLYYYLDPCAFGVKVYLHFLQTPDGGTFLQDLVTGRTELGEP